MKHEILDHGEAFSDKNIYVFFGNRNSTSLIDSEALHFGHQVHGADLIHVPINEGISTHRIEPSDGTYTSQKNLKLALYTADCVPCFVKSNNSLFSLHLGWRSLQQGLLEKAIHKTKSKDGLQIFIGPHIAYESFEVGPEVVAAFQKTLRPPTNDDWHCKYNSGKFKVSLKKLIQVQAATLGGQIYCSRVNTMTNMTHFSYRREQGTSERNISFAFLR